MVDRPGLALSFLTTPGNVNDSTMFETVMEAVRAPGAVADDPAPAPTG
ncbi:hypothetical protein ACIRQP_38315 [Streptomyces sp. NPDC102274]